MALFQIFYRQRKPRPFNHRPIYWDPQKEKLEKRVERIRSEMIKNGELPHDSGMGEYSPPPKSEEDSFRSRLSSAEENIRGSFVQGTRHLRSQYDRGENASARLQKIIKLIVLMIAAGVIVVVLRKFNIFL